MPDPPESFSADVREAFEYCDDCETVVVSLDAHRCPSRGDGGKPTAAERAQLAAADDRPLDEDVLFAKSRSHTLSFAYHELDDDGEPLHELNYQAGAQIRTREEAINRGRYPCRRCRILQESGEDNE